MFGNCGLIGNGGWGNNGIWGNNNFGINPMMNSPIMGALAQERASAETIGPTIGFSALGALIAGALTHRFQPNLPSTLIGASAALGAVLTGWIAGGLHNGRVRGNAAEQYLNTAMMNGGNGFNTWG